MIPLIQDILQILSHPLVVSICTLVVSLYLSYAFAMRREKKLTVLTRHSDEVKNLVERWKKEIPTILNPDRPMMREPVAQEIPVEKEYLFSDLKNHVPSDSSLLQTWEDYKQGLLEHQKKRFSFTQELVKCICDRIGLAFSSSWVKGTAGFSRNLVETIFSELYALSHGRSPRHLEANFEIKEESGKVELWCRGTGLVYGKKDEVIDAQSEIAKMLKELSDSLLSKEFMNMTNEMEQLKGTHQELLRQINDFLSLPLFPNECKYTKISM